MIAYICEQGAKIQKQGERFTVQCKDGERVLRAYHVEQLLLFGNVHLTAQARSLLLAKKIPVFFLTASGEYRGRLEIDEGENIFLRKRQFSLLSDLEFQVNVAKEIVIAKLHNQSELLRRLHRYHKLENLAEARQRLSDLEKEVRQENYVTSLRGLEGAGAAIYFKFFSQAFPENLGFHKRVRRPPTDPVNAVLSFLYTLLSNRCYTACRLAGLDPYLGNLHSLEYGRHSLPLDLVEEFRAPFADALALNLFSHHILKKEDFIEKENEDDPSAPKAIVLEPTALKKVLAAFSDKMDSSYKFASAPREMSYKEAIHHQALAYKKTVEGEVNYKPLIWF